MPRAVVLLSGGLDSATTAAIAREQGFELFALSVDYGQRHRFELEAARRVAQALGRRATIVIVPVDLAQFGGSALTGQIDVPKDRAADEMAAGIPVTYVPARNTVFLSLALGYAEALGGGRHLHRRQRDRLQRLSRLPAGVHRGLRAAGEPGHEGGRRRDAAFHDPRAADRR